MDKKIRVGMDISQIAHRGGVAIYTENLAENLQKSKDLETVFFYSSFRKTYKQSLKTLFESEPSNSVYKGALKDVKSYRLPPTFFEMLFNRWRNVPIEKFLGPLAIFHSSDWTQPPSKSKKITTYHDVIPIKHPEWSHPKIVAVHKRRLKLVEQEIDMVIAVSKATKKDLLEISNIPEDKIVVIYEAPSTIFKLQPEDKIKSFRKKYKLPDKFILAIGGVGERRNLKRIKEACKDYNLVIAGQTLPWLSLDELGLLYNAAEVLLYCSLYEGFGIPILDGFSSGLPVITSSVSSMPEVGGDAAMYVDPYSIKDIKEKVDVVINDKRLRQKMIKKGFKRVKQFSWEKTARETANIYRRLVE